MAIRTIQYTVTKDEITPKTEQQAGLQGETNVTDVVFIVSNDLYTSIEALSGTTLYRIQATDGAGGFHSSELLTLNATDKTVTFSITDELSNAGGICYLHLIISKMQSNTERILYSFPARLRFENTSTGSPSESSYRQDISGALFKAKQASDAAIEAQTISETAKEEAVKAKDAAETAMNTAEYAKTFASDQATYATNAMLAAQKAQSAAETAQKQAEAAESNAEDSAEQAKSMNEDTKTYMENAETAANNAMHTVEVHNAASGTHEDIRLMANEAKTIALGKANSLVFDTKEQLDSWVAGTYTRPDGKTTADLKVGDNLYIVEVGVPDYWWDGSSIQPLGAEKPNLADYYTVDRINEKIGSCIFGQMSEAEYDAACQGTGGDKMIRIKARSQFVSIYIPDLQANTDYTISFSYYNPKRYEGLNYIIDYMGIFAPDVANASIRYQRNGYLNFVSHFDSYTSSDGVFANRTIDTRTTNGIEEKTWNHVELKFNSGEFTNIALVIRPAVNEILLNDFVFAPDYFENASNWQINSSDSTQIGASGIPAPAWALLTESTNTSLDAGRIYFVY